MTLDPVAALLAGTAGVMSTVYGLVGARVYSALI